MCDGKKKSENDREKEKQRKKESNKLNSWKIDWIAFDSCANDNEIWKLVKQKRYKK